MEKPSRRQRCTCLDLRLPTSLGPEDGFAERHTSVWSPRDTLCSIISIKRDAIFDSTVPTFLGIWDILRSISVEVVRCIIFCERRHMDI